MLSRIKELISETNLSVRAFALRCGMRQQTFDMQIKGSRGISIETISAILTAFPYVSAEWLLRGEGDMHKYNNVGQQSEQINTLLCTINTLQDIIAEKNKAIEILQEQLNKKGL